MKYTLKRSKRKTVAVHICNGFVEVRAPLKIPVSFIDDFVKSKEAWINKHLSQSIEQVNKRSSFSLNYGDEIPVTGLRLTITGRNVFYSYPDEVEMKLFIPPDLSPEQIKASCIEFYQSMAAGHIIYRTEELAKQMSVVPRSVKINNAKKRWGSCGSDKRINFSWRLVMVDEDLIDYVIVHELAHLTELNHSKKFWAVVERYIPDYKRCRKQLREFQIKQLDENWD